MAYDLTTTYNLTAYKTQYQDTNTTFFLIQQPILLFRKNTSQSLSVESTEKADSRPPTTVSILCYCRANTWEGHKRCRDGNAEFSSITTGTSSASHIKKASEWEEKSNTSLYSRWREFNWWSRAAYAKGKRGHARAIIKITAASTVQ